MANTPWRRNSVKVQVDTGVEHTQSAAVPSAPGAGKGTYWVRNDSPTTPMFTDSSGSDHALGDTLGPASSTDHALARFDGITGKIIQNSTATLSDTGTLIGVLDIFIAGAEAGDAPADGDDVVIGDGTPDNHGLTFFTGPAAIGGVYFTDTAGTWQGAVTYNHTTNLLNLGAVSAVRAVVASTGIHPNTTNSVDLGTSTVLWRSIYLTNTAFAPNVRTIDATGASAGPTLLIQPGAGGPSGGAGGPLSILGGAGGGAGAGGAVTITGGLGGATDGDGGNLTLTSGAPQGSGNPGDLSILGAAAVSGNIEGGDISILAGDSSGSANGGDLVVRAGFGGATSGAGGTLELDAGSAGGGNAGGGWVYLRSGDPSGSGTPGRVVILAASAAAGNTDGGDVSIAGGEGVGSGDGGSLSLLGGDALGSGPGGSITITGGGGGSGGGGNVQVLGGNAGAGGTGGSVLIAGNPGSTVTSLPGGAFVNGANAFAGSAVAGGNAELKGGNGDGVGAGGEARVISGNGGASGVAGNILLQSGSGTSLGRVIFDGIGAEFLETAALPGAAVAAGRGRVWLRNDTNASTLMFNDDTNAARPISKMPPILLPPQSAIATAVNPATEGPATGGNKPSWNFSATATNNIVLTAQLPLTYNGGNLTFRLWYTGTSSSTANMVWRYEVERMTVGESANNANTTVNSSFTAAGPSVAENMLNSNQTLTNANLDGAQPGDFIRIIVTRLGADGGDTYGGVGEFLGLQILEP
jgi:hypothetical protein